MFNLIILRVDFFGFFDDFLVFLLFMLVNFGLVSLRSFCKVFGRGLSVLGYKELFFNIWNKIEVVYE